MPPARTTPPQRRRSQYDAGPAIPDDRPAIAAVPAPAAPSPTEARPVKFTATLDGSTDALFTRLTAGMVAEVGRIATRTDRDRVRTGYSPSRADLLRALLEVADSDPAVMTAAQEQVRARYRSTDTTT